MTAPEQPGSRGAGAILLACNLCGAVMHETLDTRSESDKCGLVYAPYAASPGQFAPCEGRLRPLAGPVAPQPGDGDGLSVADVEELDVLLEAFSDEETVPVPIGIAQRLFEFVAALRGAPPTPGVERLTGETGAVLMAQEQWEATDDCEKFDRVCPPIVYGIARAAYRMGRATSDTPEAGYCTCSGFWKHDPDCPELSAAPPTGERPTQAEIEADAEEFRPSRDVSGRTTRSVLKKRSGERPTEEGT